MMSPKLKVVVTIIATVLSVKSAFAGSLFCGEVRSVSTMGGESVAIFIQDKAGAIGLITPDPSNKNYEELLANALASLGGHTTFCATGVRVSDAEKDLDFKKFPPSSMLPVYMTILACGQVLSSTQEMSDSKLTVTLHLTGAYGGSGFYTFKSPNKCDFAAAVPMVNAAKQAGLRFCEAESETCAGRFLYLSR